MIEAEFAIPTTDGLMRLYVARPEGEGPFPGVVMLHNVRGLSDGVRVCARRVAQEGFFCAAPDLYYRLGTQIVFHGEGSDEDENLIRSIALKSLYRPFRTLDDMKALIAFMNDDPIVRAGPKGVIGYCLGGYFGPLAAGMIPDEVRAVSAIHPYLLSQESPDSPALFLDKMQGEIYYGIAEFDSGTPPEFVEQWTRLHEEKCTAQWQIEVHKGVDHGFAVPGRPIYNKPAVEVVWERTFGMFNRQLRAS